MTVKTASRANTRAGRPGTRVPGGKARGLSVRKSLRAFVSEPLAVAGVLLIALAIVVTVLAPVLAPYDPDAQIGPRFALPLTDGALLGLDGQGRDLLSRVVYGGRYALLVATVPVLAAMLVALLLGIAGGYLGGLVGQAIVQMTDILLSFPTIVIGIAFAAIIGNGFWPVFWTVFLGTLPYLLRTLYSEVRREATSGYVEAARLGGARSWRIMHRDLLPNVVLPVLTYGTTLMGAMLAFISGLSLLGIGIQPPTADWGRMISEGADSIAMGYLHPSFIPGVVVIVVALSFNWIGNGLRKIVD